MKDKAGVAATKSFCSSFPSVLSYFIPSPHLLLPPPPPPPPQLLRYGCSLDMGSGWELEETDASAVDSDDDDLDAAPTNPLLVRSMLSAFAT